LLPTSLISGMDNQPHLCRRTGVWEHFTGFVGTHTGPDGDVAEYWAICKLCVYAARAKLYSALAHFGIALVRGIIKLLKREINLVDTCSY
jgi:hypothetical protein